jgi:Ca2+-binding EF-hand superfamily protein
MLKSLALVVVLALGCKGSEPTQQAPAGSSEESANGSTGGPKGRSGKIDIAPLRRAPDGEVGVGSGRETLEERRKHRMEQMDADGNGEISEDERKASRRQRAEQLRDTLDVDKDGKVTVTELTNSRFRRLDPGAMDIDKNGDISLDELGKALETRSTAWGAGRFRDRDRARLRGITPPPTGSGSAQ